MKEFELKLDEYNTITITNIADIKIDGILPIDYKYDGDLEVKELQELITKRINEMIEKSFYGVINDW